MTREEVKSLLKIVFDVYPYVKIEDPKAMVDTWEMMFADREATEVFKATRYHLAHSKFFPTPADIMEAITKASIIYDDVPTVPQIDAPKTSYIEDNTDIDKLLDLNTEPKGECINCPKRCLCYKIA